MLAEFTDAKRIIAMGDSRVNVIAVNGYCYGKDGTRINSLKMEVVIISIVIKNFGNLFSGNAELYEDIIETLGFKAKEENQEFLVSYTQTINKFTIEFSK